MKCFLYLLQDLVTFNHMKCIVICFRFRVFRISDNYLDLAKMVLNCLLHVEQSVFASTGTSFKFLDSLVTEEIRIQIGIIFPFSLLFWKNAFILSSHIAPDLRGMFEFPCILKKGKLFKALLACWNLLATLITCLMFQNTGNSNC